MGIVKSMAMIKEKIYVFVCMWFILVIMSMAYYNCMALCKLKIKNKMCQLFESWMLKGIKLSRNLLVRVLGIL